jgi:hypothetical protein
MEKITTKEIRNVKWKDKDEKGHESNKYDDNY